MRPGRWVAADTVQVPKTHAGLVQGPLNHRHHVFQVPPGRQLRDHSAIGRVQLELGGHHAPQQAPPIFHHRRGGLVTRTLDS